MEKASFQLVTFVTNRIFQLSERIEFLRHVQRA